MRVFLIEFEFGKTKYIIAKSIIEAIKTIEIPEATDFEKQRIRRITDLGFCTIIEE